MKTSRILLAASSMCLTACGTPPERGSASGRRVEATIIEARTQQRIDAAVKLSSDGPLPAKQILFGDLHVHTTISADAFVFSLPILQGEGAHPPADACDYARFCSGLDFWSINCFGSAET